MKKLSALLLSAILVLAFSACTITPGGSAENNTKTQGATVAPVKETEVTKATESTPIPTDAPMALHTEAVGSGTGEEKQITRDEAISLAFANAGVNKEDARDLDVDFDIDSDGMFWEVDFVYGGKEYNYDVNAQTGEVLDTADKKSDVSQQLISREDAIAKALSEAGLEQDDVRQLEADLDYEHSGAYWEVEFEHGNTEYSYDINATTGEIIRVDRERD